MSPIGSPKVLLIGSLRLAKAQADARNYLSNALRVNVVEAQVEKFSPADLAEVAAVVVISPECPKVLRATPLPVVVCDAEALYDLGMTSGAPNIDYGSGSENTGFVIMQETHELAAGLHGAVSPTAGGFPVGWGRPSLDAEVVASLDSEDARHPSIFAHRPGSAMVGLRAPGKRVAFLVGSDNVEHLSKDGWTLFGEGVSWALEPDSQTAADESDAASVGSVWGPGPDELSHTLSHKDYREWVYDRIASKLFNRIVAIVSVVGLAALALIGTYINLTIDGQFTDKGDELTKEINDQFKANVSKEVAETLLDVTGIRENVLNAVKEQLQPKKIEVFAKVAVESFVAEATDPMRIQELIRSEIIEKDQLDVLVNAASEQIKTSGGIQSIILDQVRPAVLDKSKFLNQRARALQLLVIFETDEDNLRSSIREILMSDDIFDRELYEIALNTYKPSSDSDAERALFDHVVGLSVRQSKIRPEIGKGVAAFMSRYPDDFAEFVATALRRPNLSQDAANLLIDGLTKIEGDHVVDALVGLAVERNKTVSDLGWIGLALLRDRNIGFETRKQSLERLWPVARLSILNLKAELSKRTFARQNEPGHPGNPRDMLRALRTTGDLRGPGYDFLLEVVPNDRTIRGSRVDEFLDRLNRLRRDNYLSLSGYQRLVALVRGRGGDVRQAYEMLRSFRREMSNPVYDRLQELLARSRIGEAYTVLHDSRRRMSNTAYTTLSTVLGGSAGGGVVQAQAVLRSLRDKMASRTFYRLNEALEDSSLGEAYAILSRERDNMSNSAYRTLSMTLTTAQSSPGRDALAERVRRLERSLIAAKNSSRPIVDKRLKNFVIVNLLPPADDAVAWQKMLTSKLWPSNPEAEQE